MDIVDPRIETYMRSLLDRHDEPVLLEMELKGRERGFPIIGRLVGVTVELLARSIGAKRVFELGSGFGYSAYWFSRAVGPDGEVHCTDGDPANEDEAMRYLGSAGLAAPIRWHVGDAVTALDGTDGEFDVVYCDIDKHGYPDAWVAARERVRVGGLYLCDNVLWYGSVADPDGDHGRDPSTTRAVLEHNRLVAEDRRYVSTIVPMRDGLLVAHRMA
ncbi:MAG TPA: O-methyltransferase [Actinomycetota bacterium]